MLPGSSTLMRCCRSSIASKSRISDSLSVRDPIYSIKVSASRGGLRRPAACDASFELRQTLQLRDEFVGELVEHEAPIRLVVAAHIYELHARDVGTCTCPRRATEIPESILGVAKEQGQDLHSFVRLRCFDIAKKVAARSWTAAHLDQVRRAQAHAANHTMAQHPKQSNTGANTDG
jgi:hypothetical protein